MNKRKREEDEDDDDDDSLSFATLPIFNNNKEFRQWKKQKLPRWPWLNNK